MIALALLLAAATQPVKPARQTVLRSYSPEQVKESIRMTYTGRPYFTPGFPLSTPLVHATRIESLDTARKSEWKDEGGDLLTSDTGELAWCKGLVTVDTPHSPALIGFVKTNPKATANLSALVDNNHCAITLAAVDSRPIAQSAKLLLTAGSRVETTGAVTLRNLAKAKAVIAMALDAAGRALGAPIAAKQTPEGWQFAIGAPVTVWYAIEVKR